MAIRNGKLHRICLKCNKTIEPIGKYNRLCPNCLPKTENTFWHKMMRIKRNKEKEVKNLNVSII